jgi:hypothetical protein
MRRYIVYTRDDKSGLFLNPESAVTFDDYPGRILAAGTYAACDAAWRLLAMTVRK